MELQQVRYFLATCETLNFTRAAESCNVTQPALTKALKLLEYELGGELFNRQSRPMKLTDLGYHLMGKFRALHELKSDITAQARLFNNLDHTIHALGIISTIGRQAFLQLVESLQRKAPGIEISLCMHSQDILKTQLREGALELAIIINAHGDIDRFSLTPLFNEDYVLALPKNHDLLQQDRICVNDLNGVNYVYRTHCEQNDQIDKNLHAAGAAVKIRLSTNQDAIAMHMIKSGLGVSIVPKSLITHDLEARTLHDLPLTRTFNLAYLTDRDLSASAQCLHDIIIQHTKAFHAP